MCVEIKGNQLRENTCPFIAKILIVDDQSSSLKILNTAVEGLGEVYCASNGVLAIRLAHEHLPDVILLDIEMPGMDGYAVCREIKKNPRLSETAIIFVTVHDSDVHELTTLIEGGVDFLQKPLNIPVTRARVRTHVALRTAAKALLATQEDLNNIIQNVPAFIAYWDADLHNIFSNDLNGAWFGMNPIELQGINLKVVLGDINYRAIESYIAEVLRGGLPSFDMEFLRSNGDIQYGQVTLVTHAIKDERDGFLMLITDITGRKKTEAMLFEEKERIRVMLDSIGDAVIATDTAGNIIFINPIAETLTGWLSSEAVGKKVEIVMPLRDPDVDRTLLNPIYRALNEKRNVGMALNCALKRRDGEDILVEDSAAPILNQAGVITGAVIVFHDVGEARAMAIKMAHLANHDALTNLPNRMLLQDRASQALHEAKQQNNKIGMFLLDVDHFKTINDALGHSIGDEILQEIARRLQKVCRTNDTISRQGGDEFLILMPQVLNAEVLVRSANNILLALSDPFKIGQQEYALSVSIGISVFPSDSQDVESLYQHADFAMYQAKQEGRNRYRFFSSEIEKRLHARHKLESDMRDALEKEIFTISYQPKIDANSNAIVGVEALIRWNNNGVSMPPVNFIPVAEETGLIVPIGKYVFNRACREVKCWHDQGYLVRLSINISAVQFEEDSFLQTVIEILNETGIQRDLVELEITEGVLAKDVEQSNIALEALKKLGIKISIDDFGTGYSSLAYLKKFPIDVLKIDQSFVRDMLFDKSDAAIIETIIRLGQTFGLELIAEGVETREHAEALLRAGCFLMQGYYYSRPIPPMEMQQLLKTGLLIDA